MTAAREEQTLDEAHALLDDWSDEAYMRYLRNRALRVRSEVYGTLPEGAFRIACWAVCLAAAAIDLVACVNWGYRFYAYPADVGDVPQGLVFAVFAMFAALTVFLTGLFAQVHRRTWGRERACMRELDEILRKMEIKQLKMRVEQLEEKTGGKEEEDDAQRI